MIKVSAGAPPISGCWIACFVFGTFFLLGLASYPPSLILAAIANAVDSEL